MFRRDCKKGGTQEAQKAQAGGSLQLVPFVLLVFLALALRNF
jgi:hypothetical protein